ncbi:MAG: hypothetical protein SOU19_01055 [Candidatus Caccosoma sp.]|nr:hypothetical protein [Candidatus Caccosoma sp.]
METITIEKWFKFNNVIDNLNELNVLNDVEYEIKDENQALLKVKVTGNLKTSVSNEIIDETINVDIYTPFNKKIDKEGFSVLVKDYSYAIESTNLCVYVVLQIDGFVDNIEIQETKTEEETVIETKKEVIEEENEVSTNDKVNLANQELQEINELNQIKTIREERVENKNNSDDIFNLNWADSIFKLNDSYSSFLKRE